MNEFGNNPAQWAAPATKPKNKLAIGCAAALLCLLLLSTCGRRDTDAPTAIPFTIESLEASVQRGINQELAARRRPERCVRVGLAPEDDSGRRFVGIINSSDGRQRNIRVYYDPATERIVTENL